MPQTLARPEYRLADNLAASDGVVFLTGTQALIRLPLMQAARDAAAGVKSQGFISGYRGSPLGMVDQQAWKAAKLLDAAGVKFLPAINEELGATAVLGTQRVESDPERTADGVFAMWYGKGPGVDRAGDALKHGNAYGSSPHGGVLVVAGDDHGCVSSSMPHQSDVAMQSWHMPVVAPASVAEYLEFGLYGWALSRFSGNWVGFTALSEIVESGSTVDLDLTNARVAAWKGARRGRGGDRLRPPRRRPALPLARPAVAEDRGAPARQARRGARLRQGQSARPPGGRVAAGDGRHRHLRQGALRPARGVPPARHLARRARRGGRAALQGGPVVSARADPHRRLRRRALREILVVEEKGAVVETQMRDQFYNAAVRPAIVGKRDAAGPAARLRARRAAAVAADRDRRRLARGALPAARPAPPGGRLHRAAAALERRRRGQAPALLLRRLPAQHLDQGARGLARPGRHRLPLHGLVDGPRHRGPDPDGRRGRRLGLARDVHQGAARLPEPRRRHLLPLGLPGDPPGDRRQDQHHLQDPVQRRGGDDRRPAGRRHDLGRRHRPPGRGRGRDQGGRALRRHRQVRRDPATASPTAPSSIDARPARRGAAAAARAAGRHRPDLRADLRRREAPPQEEGRAGRPGAAPLHQRTRLRRLRRLLGAVELRRRRAARDRARQEAQDRPVELQQGLLLRQRLLPELRRRRRRQPAQAPRRARRAGRGAVRGARSRSCRCRRRTPGPGRTTCWSPASAAPAWSRSAR